MWLWTWTKPQWWLSKIPYLFIASGNLGMFQRHFVNNYTTRGSQQEEVHLSRDKWVWHLLASTRVRGRALAMLTPARRPLAVRKSYFETWHVYFGVVLCQCRWLRYLAGKCWISTRYKHALGDIADLLLPVFCLPFCWLCLRQMPRPGTLKISRRNIRSRPSVLVRE